MRGRLRRPAALVTALAAAIAVVTPPALGHLDQEGGVVRISAADASNVQVAIDTSLAVPNEQDYLTEQILVARDDTFADALASGPLQDRARLVLVPTDGPVPDEVAAIVARSSPYEIVILGGPAAISTTVEQQLRALGPEVVRVSGDTRFETATAIADHAHVDRSTAYLARGYGRPGFAASQAFADSMSLGALAAETTRPVLLTRTDELHPETRRWLQANRVGEVVVIGGPAAISDAVVDQVRALGIAVRRVAGDDRAATAVAINAERGLPATTAERMLLLDGRGDDAWAAGFTSAHLAARTRAAVLLAESTSLPVATRDFLARASQNLRRDRAWSYPFLVCARDDDRCDAASALLDLDDPVTDCRPVDTRLGGRVQLLAKSRHLAAWWGGEGDEAMRRARAESALASMEDAWARATALGIPYPTGSPDLCVNLYDGTSGGAVPAGLGPGVGSDWREPHEEAIPFIHFDFSMDPATTVTPEGDFALYVHELFHILQFNVPYEFRSTEIPIVEGGAEWFAAYARPQDPVHDQMLASVVLSPHSAMWTSGDHVDTPPANPAEAGHAYGIGWFFTWLTEHVGLPPSVMVDAMFATRGNRYEAIADAVAAEGRDLGELLADMAARNATFDFPNEAAMRAWLERWQAESGAPDESIAIDVPAAGRGGAVRPPDDQRPSAYGYNVARIDPGEHDRFLVVFDGDERATDGTPAAFEVRTVVRRGDVRTYRTIPIGSRNRASWLLDVAGADEAYVVVAATPDRFDGLQRYGYALTVTPG